MIGVACVNSVATPILLCVFSNQPDRGTPPPGYMQSNDRTQPVVITATGLTQPLSQRRAKISHFDGFFVRNA